MQRAGSVRRATQADLGGLRAVVEASMGRGSGGAWQAGAVAGALEPPLARAWLAEWGDSAPVGFVFARKIVDLLEIDLVGVHPSYRRCGLAQQLVRALLEAERAEGLAEARLELAAGNAPARALYAGLGFVVVGRRARYYPDGEDALLLSSAFG